MRRGTTPTITFKIKTELDLNDISECWITFKTVLGKKIDFGKDQLFIDPELKTIEVSFSQAETLFYTPGKIMVQLRLKMNDETAYASKIAELTMEDILKDGEI